MGEHEDIVREANALRQQGECFLLATVVNIEGSSYRRPGARMIATADRRLAGCVSGGCLENDVVRRGPFKTSEVNAAVVRYDSTSDDESGWGVGLGCNGVVDVLIERVAPDASFDPTRFIAACLDEEDPRPGVLVTVFASRDPDAPVGSHIALRGGEVVASTVEGSAADPGCGPGDSRAFLVLEAQRTSSRARIVSRAEGCLRALIEPIEPAPRLFVLGGGHDAIPLVLVAKAAGWNVTVACPRAAWASRFTAADRVMIAATPRCIRAEIDRARAAYVILMAHDYDRDRAVMAEALLSRARYIGALGPAKRAERMLAEIAPALPPSATSAESLARVHAPAGLDLGAETPDQIALAILAEAQAVWRGSHGGFLRTSKRTIHGRVACAVLAGGASRRLGRPKQLVRMAGEPLVRRLSRICSASNCDAVGIVLGAHRDIIGPALEGAGVEIIHNEAWEEGIASSIRSAVAWARAQDAAALVLVLGDQPFVDAGHIDRLVATWRTGAPAATSSHGDVVAPPAVFDASLFAALSALEGDQGAQRILRERSDVARVPWASLVVDVDTEEDVASLSAI